MMGIRWNASAQFARLALQNSVSQGSYDTTMGYRYC
jgi:hypothetical protein